MSASEAVILFMGAPGSGKGTQSSWLSAQLGIPCLSTGEILRSAARENSLEGFRLRRVLASGSLVSDEVVCEVVASALRKKAAAGGLILDGFPRTVRQAAFLDNLLAEMGLPRPTVIHLDISAPGLLARLTGRRQCAKCGAVYNLLSKPSRRGSRCEIDGGALVERDDDREEVILRRLAHFEKEAQPLFSYYKDANLRRVDGDREMDAVASDLLRITADRFACAGA